MDSKRGMGGIVGTLGTGVMSVIQTTHPEWLGNHPWILPVLIVALMCSIMLWLLQYRWAQKLFGISRSSAITQSATSVLGAEIPPRRLKIIEAHYGVEGINNPDVTRYLLERLRGNSYAELVGADLFHGFDPLPNNPDKKLTVRYSFDGKEMGIVRPEHEWLILPEDSFLRKLLNAEVSRAQEVTRQWEEDKREYAKRCLDYRAELGRYSELFTPLQVEVFQLAADLRDFLRKLGPRPDADWSQKNESDPDWMAKKLTERQGLQGPWVVKLMHGYAGDYAPRVKSLMHKLGQMNLSVGPLSPYTDSVGSEVNILHVARTLDSLAVEIAYQTLAVAQDADRDTVRKYEDLTANQMEQIIRNYPEARTLIDAAYKRVDPTKRPF